MKSIRKAAEALRALAAPPHEIAVGDLARILGATPSNASRILAELRAVGLVEQDPASRRYRPGPLIASLAVGARRPTSLLSAIEAEMEELVPRTQHTAWAGVLDGADVVALSTRHGGYPVRFGVDLGRRLPAHAAAMGKALLALMTDDMVRRVLPTRLARHTDRTLTRRDALLADLAATRRRGYAVSDEELFPGIKSVAVAFPARGEDPAVALSISFPLFSLRSDDAPEDVIRALLDSARAIRERIGLA